MQISFPLGLLLPHEIMAQFGSVCCRTIFFFCFRLLPAIYSDILLSHVSFNVMSFKPESECTVKV